MKCDEPGGAVGAPAGSREGCPSGQEDAFSNQSPQTKQRCRRCGVELRPSKGAGRKAVYCNARCRTAVHRDDRRSRADSLVSARGATTDAEKTSARCQTLPPLRNSAQVPGGAAPRAAVEREVVGARHWEPAVSSDGVAILVARTRRALS
jgi:hypothetical protein